MAVAVGELQETMTASGAKVVLKKIREEFEEAGEED